MSLGPRSSRSSGRTRAGAVPARAPRGALSCLLLVLTLTMLGLGSASALGDPGDSSGRTWTTVPDGHPLNPNMHVLGLDGVAALSTNDAWAVGTYIDRSKEVNRPAVEHWNGLVWMYVDTPVAWNNNSGLGDVVAFSSSDVWAVGGYVDIGSGNVAVSRTLAEHFDGSNWTQVPTQNPKGHSGFSAIAGVAPDDVWAVGLRSVPGHGHRPLIEHWNGTAWSIVPSPKPPTNDSNLWEVAAVSRGDVWAVGETWHGYRPTALIEHWDGRAWRLVDAPSPGESARLGSVAAASANDVWAVGDWRPHWDSNPEYALVEHWDGTAWHVVRAVNPGDVGNALGGVVAISTSQVWAVGGYASGSENVQTLIERWNGKTWKVVPSPNMSTADGGGNSLAAVTAVPGGGGDLWAVGGFYNPNAPSEALIERYGTSPVGPMGSELAQTGLTTSPPDQMPWRMKSSIWKPILEVTPAKRGPAI